MKSNNFFRIIVIAFLLTLIFESSDAQSLTGVNGLLNAPNATMLNDGTFFLGTNYINHKYVESYISGKYNCLVYYFDITFLPFLEVNFRNTRLLGIGEGTNHTVDRMISLRLQLLKEKRILPSIVIGSNDIFTWSNTGNQYFSALYTTATKTLKFVGNTLALTFGYGLNINYQKNLIGCFGGIEYKPVLIPSAGFIIEYDTERINLGVKAIILKHIVAFVCTDINFKYLSVGLAYRIFLKKNSAAKSIN